jgi:hypothetical protein
MINPDKREANIKATQRHKQSIDILDEWTALLGHMLGGLNYSYAELHEIRECLIAAREWSRLLMDTNSDTVSIILDNYTRVVSNAIQHANLAKHHKGEFKFVKEEQCEKS